MCGTAAAASSRSTVTRTISEPARASAATCRAVASTSAVSVLVIDCTTTGAPPPTITPPTSTATERRRGCGEASVMIGLLLRRVGARARRSVSTGALGPPQRGGPAPPADLDHRRLRGKAGGTRGAGQRARDLGRRRLADRAAALADQEHHELAGEVIVHAGDEGVAALDAVH